MPRFSLYPVADSYLLVALVALALAALIAIGPGRDRLAPAKRWTLVALRVAVFLLIVAAMLRPTIVYTRTHKQAATLVVLGDQSRSMTIADAIGGQSRYEALRRALAAATPPLQRLARDFELRAYGFDAETHPLTSAAGRIALPEKCDGAQTAIGAALADVMRLEAGKRLLGVVLLSDGAQRALPPRDLAPQTAAAQLRHLSAPIYAVSLGQSRGLGQAKDIAVRDLVANATVFVNNDLTVSGQVRVDGMVNRDITVRALFETEPGKMTVVAQKTLRATSDGQILPVELQFTPEAPGERKLTLEAVEAEGELVTTNNRLSTFVNVLKGGLKVLYIEGVRRPEAKFLRRALDASAEIKVDYLWVDAQRPETRPGDFLDRFKPGAYDVYILGDVDSRAFADGAGDGTGYKALSALAEAVNQGAGLIMLGGYHSFGPGGYARTPLSAVLPITMNHLERQEFGRTPREDVQLRGPLRIAPTRFGQLHSALTLAPGAEANRALWSRLPPMDGANRFAALAPGAIVLADDGHGHPLLVTQNYGAGRVVALAIDSTWRWWMHGEMAAHKRFWRQMVLWLARRDQLGESMVWVRLDKRRYAPNERAEFRLGVQAPDGSAITDATVEVNVVLPDGAKRPVRPFQQGEQWVGSFRETQLPGDYAIEVTATRNGAPLGNTQARFLVYEQDLELDNAGADPAMLESLAALTGGESVAPEQLPALIERLLQKTVALEVQEETKRSLWDKWPFFLLLVAVMGTEWFLRKRWGLV